MDTKLKYYDGKATVTKASDLPAESFNAALVEEQSYGDDGYGGTSCTSYLQVVLFESEGAMKTWVLNAVAPKFGSRKTFQLVRINPINFELNTVLTIQP